MTVHSSGFGIMRANKSVIWFDAITRLSENYSASVTKHPLSNGALVTDHTTFDNPRFSISGILSDADFNLSRPTISDTEISTNKQYINNTKTATKVFIDDSTSSAINKILPEVIAQYTVDQMPIVFVTPQAKAKVARAVKDELVNMITAREVFMLFEFDDGRIRNSYRNCVMTSLDFEEDVNTGDGIFPNMQIEQVTYSTIKTVTVKINKGRKTGASKTLPTTQVDPSNAPSSYNKASVLDYATPAQ